MEKMSKEEIVKIFETEYPELSNEFKNIQNEQYELFARKMMDYGLNNVTLGGDIVNNSEDKKFSLTGLTIRLTDKINPATPATTGVALEVPPKVLVKFPKS